MESPTSIPLVPDFTLIRRIGAGSYGDVWLGRSVTGIYRAIKVVSRARFEDERPFFRELEGITRFQQAVGDQPRQLALLHVGRDEAAGVFYYVMELADDAVSGTDIDPATYVPLTLRELRARRTVLPAEDCVRIGSELATALAELHRAGLLHRDVKPSNIILVDGRAKLADIGLIASSEQTVTSIGTPEYAPPEGIGSVRADLFSLGKVLYELATGLRSSEFPRLPADLSNRPDAAALVELNEIILRTCHPDPAQRYANADMVLADLRYLQAGKSVQELNRTRRQMRFLVRIGAVAGACLVVAIAILGVRNYFTLRALAALETAFRISAEANERLARYVSDMHFAQLGLSGGDLGAARTALRHQIPQAGQEDLRGLEWYALWHQSEGQATRTLGDVGGPAIVNLALSPDGHSLAAIERGTPNRAVLIDLNTSHRKVIVDDCFGLGGFTSDGAHLIVLADGKSVCIVNVATGHRRRQSARGRFVEGSGDGRTMLLVRPARGDDTLFLWDTEEERQIYEWKPESSHPHAVLSGAAATRDHRLIAATLIATVGATRFDEIVVHDVRSGVELGRISTLSRVTGVRFSPDGSQLAVATETEVLVASVANLTELRHVAKTNGNVALDFSPDGSQLAMGGSDRLLRVWSPRQSDDLAALEGHESAIVVVAWTADGRKLVSGGLDGTCRIWDLNQDMKRSVVSGQWSEELGSVVLSADGAELAVTGGDGSVRLMKTDRLSPLGALADAFMPLAFADHGRALLSLSHDYELIKSTIDDGTAQPIRPRLAADSRILSFGTSPNKRFAALGLNTGEVHVWDLLVPEEVGKFPCTKGDVRSVAVSNDGENIAASDWEGNLGMVSITGGPGIAIPTENAVVTSLGFSPNGGLLAIGDDKGYLLIWDVVEKSFVLRAQAHSAMISCLFFSPDRSRLLTGGADGLIVAWTTQLWRPLAAWLVSAEGPPSQHGVYSLEMDDAGLWLVAMTYDGYLQRWACRPNFQPGNMAK